MTFDFNKAIGQMIGADKKAPQKLELKNTPTSIEIANSRLKQAEMLEQKMRSLMAGTLDAGRYERIKVRLIRLIELKNKLKEYLKKRAEQTRLSEYLAEFKYKPIRAYNATEKLRKVNFKALNDTFNNLQGEFEDELDVINSSEVNRIGGTIKNKLDVGDIMAIATLTYLLRGKLQKVIGNTINQSYEVGKTMATNELKISRVATPRKATQIMNLDAADLADGFASNLEQLAKSAVKSGLAADASTDAIVSHVQETLSTEIDRATMNLSGTIVGQYVNRGRMDIFTGHADQIASYVRSEVIDDVTCDMCAELDEKVVSPSDPFSKMDIVHTHCRGLWIPVFKTDEDQPEIDGIPQSVKGNFQTVDGRPIVNAFKQLKKPIAK